jgi:hypothetical protein
MIYGEAVCNIVPHSIPNQSSCLLPSRYLGGDEHSSDNNKFNRLSKFCSNGLQVVALVSVLLRSFVLSIRSIVVRRTRGRFILISIEKRVK